ncbi:uncharacterized protein LOC125376055 [Haliotis rufescens]|uniref:uncharacterized protein LOC125376055 n=1 Tax=Haliotis rufescens TaxID=6454 RepID=UPI00201F93A1|nr:uncharacterized protein LOC125376055 [Haliotis rufescens]
MEKLTTAEVVQMLFDEDSGTDDQSGSVAELLDDGSETAITNTVNCVLEREECSDKDMTSDDTSSAHSDTNDSDYVPDSQDSSNDEPLQSPMNYQTNILTDVIHSVADDSVPLLDSNIVAAQVDVQDLEGVGVLTAVDASSVPHHSELVQVANDKTEGSHDICMKRRRTANPDTWKRNIRKRKRSLGHEYLNYKNQMVPAKGLIPKSCRKMCFEKMEDNADTIFEEFYRMASKKDQDRYLFGLIDRGTEKKQFRSRSNAEGTRKRSCPFKYHVKLAGGERFEVCYGCFLQVHAIDRARVRHLMDTDNPMSPNPDKRGSHTPKNKTPDDVILKIRNHIASFHPLKSHYSPNDNPHKQYLPANLNIRRMWRICVKEHEPEAWESILQGEKYKGQIPEQQYRKIFNEYSLSFGYPRTDTCGTCDLLEAKIKVMENDQEKATLVEEKTVHVT